MVSLEVNTDPTGHSGASHVGVSSDVNYKENTMADRHFCLARLQAGNLVDSLGGFHNLLGWLKEHNKTVFPSILLNILQTKYRGELPNNETHESGKVPSQSYPCGAGILCSNTQ